MLNQEIANALPHWTVIGFTGHRKIDHPDIAAKALKCAVDRVAKKHPRIAGVSSAASGGDTLFAEEMVRQDCPFSLILPFSLERFHQDFRDEPEAWDRVRKLISKANDLEMIYPPLGDREASDRAATEADEEEQVRKKKEADAAAYMDAGYRTIDRAEVVIALWDGKPPQGFGGTACAVEYARSILRPLLIVNTENGHIVEERMEEFGREEDSAHSDDGGAAAEPAALPGPIKDPKGLVMRFFDARGGAAKKDARRTRFMIQASLQLYLLGTIIGIANVAFNTERLLAWMLTGASAISVVAATVLVFLSAKSHDRWLRCRTEAEICRSFLATWEIRRHAIPSHQPRTSLASLGKLFPSLQFLRQMDRTPLLELDEVRSKYNSDRIENQIGYFSRELTKARRTLGRTKHMMNAFGALSAVSAVLAFGVPLFRHGLESLDRWLQYLALILPLVATSLGLTLITQEATRRATRYHEIKNALENLHRRFQAVSTWDSLARVANEVEEELLQELVEWQSFIRFTRDVGHRS